MTISKMTKRELTAYLEETRTELQALATRGESLTGDDAEKFDALEADFKEARERLDAIDKRAAAVIDGSFASEDGAPGAQKPAAAAPALRGAKTLTRDQSVAQWQRDNGHVKIEVSEPTPRFDAWFRGVATGNWDGATNAERALSTGVATAGGVMVPSVVAGEVLDLARAKSQVVAAGAQVAPMAASKIILPRLDGDPGPAWRNESTAIVTNDLTFSGVELSAKSLARQLILSRELLMDAPGISQAIANAFAASFASEIDRAALLGTSGVGQPTILGVLGTPGVVAVAHTANGAPISWDFLLDAQARIEAANYTPTAHIVSSRSVGSLRKVKSSDGVYLAAPANSLPLLPSNTVPNNLTAGTSSDTSYVFTADWSTVIIGVRESFELQWLTEKHSGTGEIGVIGHFRGDVAILQPKAATVDTGIRG